ncbi:hypothetical protein WDC_0093 [Paucilactobacillus wasatchensis]|uniref:Uncharacterized protein n=2 Tax=Paucilactobacillus wasatchensis TaxID=1335616 RepID=A0A0D0Y7W6_9LACO|nr:hypothetical protein WDC_0093 [Paucilactobacillus wasatchensis]
MAKRAIEVLSDQTKLQQLSDGAYDQRQHFDEDNAWALWRKYVVR